MPDVLLESQYLPFSFDWIRAEVRKVLPKSSAGYSMWIQDITVTDVIAEDEEAHKLWRFPYSVTETGVTLGQPTQVIQDYRPVVDTSLQEALGACPEATSDVRIRVSLLREAGGRYVRPDGTIPVAIIRAGPGNPADRHWYPEATLAADYRIFEGRKMFVDHPTSTEELERPERSLRDWVATMKNVRWDAATREVRADAHIVQDWFIELAEKAGDEIGVSINAYGKARPAQPGELPAGYDGWKYVEKLVFAASADFVTEAGAGGKLLPLMESLRGTGRKEADDVDLSKMTLDQLKQARPDLVAALTESRTVTPDPEVVALKEANKTLSTELVSIKTDLLTSKCKEAVQIELDSVTDLPKAALSKIAESLSNRVFEKGGAVDTEAVKAAVKTAVDAERSYLASLAESSNGKFRIGGFGPTTPPQQDPADEKRAKEAKETRIRLFERMGYSRTEAEKMAE